MSTLQSVRALYVGTDAREGSAVIAARREASPDAQAPAWLDEWREQYLLRPEIVRPLSVDTMVWPQARGAEGRPLVDPLPWTGIDETQQRLGAAQGEVAGAAAPVWVVIGVMAGSPEEEQRLARERGIDAALIPEPAWALLGYDVGDGGVSGLCNCGYTPDELAVLRPRWAPRLNEHGLFSDVDAAMGFRAITDVRVPEHAPFLVFAMWRLPRAGR
ncbi:MAG: hypothetical protein WKG00_11940 [Polyangiaceae bacterium]